MPRIKSEEELPDSRNILDTFPKNLVPRIGYKGIVIPLLIPCQKKETGISTISTVEVSCEMSSDIKGSLSIDLKKTVESFANIRIFEFVNSVLDTIKKNGFVKVDYSSLLKKISPVSKLSSWVEVPASYYGKIDSNGNKSFYSKVKVYYNSSCPRSKEISDYGAHSQLSSATITTELMSNDYNLHKIVELVDNAASCPIYNIVSDLDESYITEQSYEKPVFVEDVARKLSVDLSSLLDNNIKDYLIEIEHHESIHTSVATATINAGRKIYE